MERHLKRLEVRSGRKKNQSGKLTKNYLSCILGRISSSQDDLDDDSIQGKMISFDNFSMFSSEWGER